MNKIFKLILIIFCLNLILLESVKAESTNGFSVMTGVTQPLLLGGANIAAQYEIADLVFEYSHGINLKLNKFKQSMSSSDQSENLEINIPWTTGAGVGYKIAENIHFLIEVKAHKFEVSIPGGTSATYTGYSAGPGIFYTKYFGINFFIQPNLRYWPTIGSTESGNQVQVKRNDGSTYTHKVYDFGLFANMNLGWSF